MEGVLQWNDNKNAIQRHQSRAMIVETGGVCNALQVWNSSSFLLTDLTGLVHHVLDMKPKIFQISTDTIGCDSVDGQKSLLTLEGSRMAHGDTVTWSPRCTRPLQLTFDENLPPYCHTRQPLTLHVDLQIVNTENMNTGKILVGITFLNKHRLQCFCHYVVALAIPRSSSSSLSSFLFVIKLVPMSKTTTPAIRTAYELVSSLFGKLQ